MGQSDHRFTFDDKKYWTKADIPERMFELMTSIPASKMVERSGIASTTSPVSVLDLGCGKGVVSRQIYQQVPPQPKQLSVTALDISDPLVQSVRALSEEEGWPNYSTVVADAKDTHLPSDSFTHILGQSCITGTGDYSATLKEAHRLLKRDGLLLVSEPIVVGFQPFVDRATQSEGLPELMSLEKIHATRGDWVNKAWAQQQLEQHGFTFVDWFSWPGTIHVEQENFIKSVSGHVLQIQMNAWTAEQKEKYTDKLYDAFGKAVREASSNGITELKSEWWIAIGKKAGA